MKLLTFFIRNIIIFSEVIFLKVTLKKISDETGISCATLSRVLTGNGYVKPETRTAVEAALERYGYKYTPSRKKVASVFKKIVLIICGDITNNVYTSYIAGINSELGKENIKTLICNTDYDSDTEEEYLSYASHSGFAGVIMLNAVETPSLLRLLQSVKCPIVFINRYLRSVNVNIVSVDTYRGGYLATDYLIRNGHRNIAHLCGPENSTTVQNKRRGYEEAMINAGLDPQKCTAYRGDLHYKSGYDFGRQLIRSNDPTTAVFSDNAVMASGLIDAFFDNGKSIPEDLSVVCADQLPDTLKGKVQLTTVSCDLKKLGVVAARRMIEIITTDDQNKQSVIFPPVLTVRDSVAQCQKKKI